MSKVSVKKTPEPSVEELQRQDSWTVKFVETECLPTQHDYYKLTYRKIYCAKCGDKR